MNRNFSLNEVMEFREGMFHKSMELVSRKGADYNRVQQLDGDTLFNLRVCEHLGIVNTAERGILVRLSDKFMRLVSLAAEPTDPAVKDESLADTAADIHNYVDYLVLMAQARREEMRIRGQAQKVAKTQMEGIQAGRPHSESTAAPHTPVGAAVNVYRPPSPSDS